MISTETAYNIRFVRGLHLPHRNVCYKDARIQAIAYKQSLLFLQICDLDDQLKQIYKECCDDDSRKSKRDCV
jgi:hypothetical protein